MPMLKIQQWSSPLDIGKGTILDTALRQGVPYPHSCRSGECGTCKTRLVSGEVEHDPYLKEALSDVERDEGFVLACRARPKTNVEVAWVGDVDPGACVPVRCLKATVVGLELAAHNVSRLRLEVRDQPLAFAAGQYVRLSVGKLPARSFSMANRPDEAILEFHIRHIPNGLVSGYVAHELRLSDTVRIEGPFGSSHLREHHDGPIVAVAGGTGLAPMLSVVRTALDHMSARPIHLYFGVQDEADIYAEQDLSELAAASTPVQTHVVLSAPRGPTTRRTGFVHQALATDLTDLAGAKVYTAGPPPMVEAVAAAVVERGAGCDDIHTDPFVASADGRADLGKGLRRGLARLFGSRPMIPAHST